MPRPPFLEQVGRGLRRQCPHCGQPGIFRGFRLAEHCPRCGHQFEREPGYWVGAVIVNTAIAIGTLFVSFGLMFWVTWPDVPWEWLTIVVIALTGIVPIFLYPWARSLWMAYDLYVHPLEDEELKAGADRIRR